MVIIKVTAPGKTILHGEHAVVYGKAAIAASLGLKTQVITTTCSDNVLHLDLRLFNLQLEWNFERISTLTNGRENPNVDPPTEGELLELNQFVVENTTKFNTLTDFQKIAVTIFLYLYSSIGSTYKNSCIGPCVIKVDSELCIGAGMGSSASYSVCLVTTFLAVLKKIEQELSQADLALISKWAFCAETICHGWPSGIDNSICTYGGALLFENGKIVSQLPNMSTVRILLVNTGVERNTKVLVGRVKQKMNAHSGVISHVLDAMNALSLESWEILKKMPDDAVGVHLSSLQELVSMNQHLLNCIGVGHSKLNAICEVAESNDFVAKLTGAGGGGCAFVILPPGGGSSHQKIESMKTSLNSLGMKYWEVLLGGPGVHLSISS